MSEDQLIGRAFEEMSVKMLEPKKNGVYQIMPIDVGNDYVAIAPVGTQRSSNIIVPDEESPIGIIVGIGPLVPEAIGKTFKVGSVVKFAPKPVVCNLDGLYSFYNDARIVLVRFQNILAIVPGGAVMTIGVDEAKK